jgi:hypothetical protein
MKKLLAHLEIREISQENAWHGLALLAETNDIDYRRVEIPNDSTEEWMRAWREVKDLINEASTFLLTDSMVLREYAAQLKARVSDGARILIEINSNDFDIYNSFLAEYGLAGSSFRILSDPSGSSVLPIPREPSCYIDRKLLEGVENVVFSSVTAVDSVDAALQVLCAPEDAWCVDRRSDYFANWHRRRVGCIARWEGANGGAVVVLGGDVLWDSSRKWTDLTCVPGIRENTKLATNLIRYAVKSETTITTPDQYRARAEINLADFVLTVLRSNYGVENWWSSGVPLPIRQECAKRQEDEAHRKFQKEAYLDLIHLKRIIEHNWRFFKPYFEATRKPETYKLLDDSSVEDMNRAISRKMPNSIVLGACPRQNDWKRTRHPGCERVLQVPFITAL